MKHKKENALEYTQRWVGYFDLLGFRKLVDERHLGYILDKYIHALKEVQIQRRELDVCHKWFSDTFLFYTNEDSLSAFWNIENACRFFYRSMFLRRIPLRGCLSIGDFYVNEEKAILIGPALVDAYDLSEKQNWVGYVLAPSSIKQIENLGSEAQSLWDYFKSKSYIKYKVPCKDGKKENLWACTMNIYESTDQHRIKDLHRLWNSLIEMQIIAQMDSNTEGDLAKEIDIKYVNSKEFFLRVFPELKKFVKDQNRQIPL